LERDQAAAQSVTVLFGDAAAEVFDELPRNAQCRAAESIELMVAFPHMYPVRQRGVMKGYRYFIAGRYLFYYSATSAEIRIAAIIPVAMRLA
jgi:plasmid stabilization system protein ParE